MCVYVCSNELLFRGLKRLHKRLNRKQPLCRQRGIYFTIHVPHHQRYYIEEIRTFLHKTWNLIIRSEKDVMIYKRYCDKCYRPCSSSCCRYCHDRFNSQLVPLRFIQLQVERPSLHAQSRYFQTILMFLTITDLCLIIIHYCFG